VRDGRLARVLVRSFNCPNLVSRARRTSQGLKHGCSRAMNLPNFAPKSRRQAMHDISALWALVRASGDKLALVPLAGDYPAGPPPPECACSCRSHLPLNYHRKRERKSRALARLRLDPDFSTMHLDNAPRYCESHHAEGAQIYECKAESSGRSYIVSQLRRCY